MESRDLKAGDLLVNDEGKEYAVQNIEVKQETVKLYNFSVGDYHTYFVSELKIWTHNCGGRGGMRSSSFSGADRMLVSSGKGVTSSTKKSTTTKKATKGTSNGYKYWNKTTEFNNVKVYQRDDITDSSMVDARGRTNLERMKKGLAPLGPHGKSINLHHTTQRNTSSIAEVT